MVLPVICHTCHTRASLFTEYSRPNTQCVRKCLMSQETRNQDFSIFLDTKSFLRGKVESDLLDSTELPLYSEISKYKPKQYNENQPVLDESIIWV